MDDPSPIRMDKTAFSAVPLAEADDELSYWLTRTPEERWAAVELIRQTLYGYDPSTARLQRVLEIAQKDWG